MCRRSESEDPLPLPDTAATRDTGRATRREQWLLAAAIALLLAPALLDLPGLAEATVHLQNTKDALVGVVSALLTAGLVSAWAKRRADRRERVRFDGIAGVAFRSLAQTANDAGRMLLAPVIGADLWAAGVPGFTPDHHRQNVERLRAASIDARFMPRSGVWDDGVEQAAVSDALERLCLRPDFAGVMFRTTSDARRRLQAGLANWAPIMVNVPGTYDHLATGWLLSDQIVVSLERWRTAGSAPAEQVEDALASARDEYLETVRLYQRWISELVPLSRLPR